MPEPQKAFLFNKNSQPGENTPHDEGRPFDNLRSSHQQASLKDMTKGTQKMTPGRQGHPRTGKEHTWSWTQTLALSFTSLTPLGFGHPICKVGVVGSF